MREFLPLQGRVRAVLRRPNGRVWTYDDSNIVVDVGKEMLAEILLTNDGSQPGISHAGLGLSNTALDLNQVDLSAPWTNFPRVDVAASAIRAGNELIYTGTFNNSISPAEEEIVREMGLFTAATAGSMFARWLPQAFLFETNATLDLTWTLTVG